MKSPARANLIIEPPVHVLPKQCFADGGKSIDFQQAQTLFEGVVDLDLALATHNKDTTGTVAFLLAS